MDIVKPTDAELAALLSEHSHRYPEKARFTVTDGDADVVLPVLIGNPSGACKMPAGKPVSQAWDATVSSTFRMRADADAQTVQLAADCVLWPDAATWNGWTQRWPALPEIAQVVIRRKVGASLAMIEEPAPSVTKPDVVAAAIARNPAGKWCQLKPADQCIDVVVTPPDAGIWRLFVDAMKKPGAESGKLTRDLALSCITLAVKADGSAIPADEIMDRWPGMMLLVGAEVASLAGINAKAELGFW